MHNNIKHSSIKAYCLELMKETSTSGAVGPYETPRAARKITPKDKNSPTGFESSPKPNMYTKTMKFKIVDPKQRLNSKDLWKGEHLNENNIPEPTDFPIKISSYPQGQLIGDWLKKHGYNLDMDKAPLNMDPLPFTFYLKDIGDKNITWDRGLDETTNEDDKLKTLNTVLRKNEIKPVYEIKINNPLKTLKSGNKYLVYTGMKFEPYIFNRIVGPKDNQRYIFDSVDGNSNLNIGEDHLFNGNIKSLNESKYNQFKKSTTKRQPKEILHKAIKQIQLKLDEVNKLIEFTSRIKGELTEGDQEIEYLKRTKDSIYKMQERLKEVFNKLNELENKTS